MRGILDTDTVMDIVRVLLGLELALGGLALVLAAIRAFGPPMLKNGLIHSIRVVKKLGHST